MLIYDHPLCYAPVLKDLCLNFTVFTCIIKISEYIHGGCSIKVYIELNHILVKQFLLCWYYA